MASSYNIPTSSLSKLQRYFNAKKAAGQIVQPWELEEAYAGELSSLASQKTANRQLSLAQEAQAETKRANAVTEALNAQKLAEAKAEYESTLANNQSQYASTLALQQAALDEQKRQAAANESLAQDQLEASKSASKVSGIGSLASAGVAADKLTGGALSGAIKSWVDPIKDTLKGMFSEATTPTDVPITIPDTVDLSKYKILDSLKPDQSLDLGNATSSLGTTATDAGTKTVSTQPWDYDVNGKVIETLPDNVISPTTTEGMGGIGESPSGLYSGMGGKGEAGIYGDTTSTGKAVSLGTEPTADYAFSGGTNEAGTALGQQSSTQAGLDLAVQPTAAASDLSIYDTANQLQNSDLASSTLDAITEASYPYSAVSDLSSQAFNADVALSSELDQMMGLTGATDVLGDVASEAAASFIPQPAYWTTTIPEGATSAVDLPIYRGDSTLAQYQQYLAEGGTPLSQGQIQYMTYNPQQYAQMYGANLNPGSVSDAIFTGSQTYTPYDVSYDPFAQAGALDSLTSDFTPSIYDAIDEANYAYPGTSDFASDFTTDYTSSVEDAIAEANFAYPSALGTWLENAVMAPIAGFPVWVASNILKGWGLGCIIVTACTDPHSPEVEIAREYRDKFMDLDQIRGYYMIAEKVVPLIKRSNIFKGIVKRVLVDSLVDYGKSALGKQEQKPRLASRTISKGFLWLCRKVGQTRETFTRCNGEVV